jgi:hypothetical protein
MVGMIGAMDAALPVLHSLDWLASGCVADSPMLVEHGPRDAHCCSFDPHDSGTL